MNDVALNDLPCPAHGTHRIDIFRIAAPALAVVSLGVSVAVSNFDAKMTHSGLTLMMVCLSVYVFHLKGRPIAQRPPVEFTPFIRLVIAGFLLGTFLCGMGIAGPFGFALQFLPTIAAIAISHWLNSPAGVAKRKQIAARHV